MLPGANQNIVSYYVSRIFSYFFTPAPPVTSPKKTFEDVANASYIKPAAQRDDFIAQNKNQIDWDAYYDACWARDVEGQQFDEAWQVIAFCGNKELAEKYFTENAQLLNAKHRNSEASPLHYACWRGELEVVKYLSQHIKNPVISRGNQTPLDWAKKANCKDVIDYLTGINIAISINPQPR